MYKIVLTITKKTRRIRGWCVQLHTSCSISLLHDILPEKSGSLGYSVAAILCSNKQCTAPLGQ